MNLLPGHNKLVTVIVNLLFPACYCDLDCKQKYSAVPSSFVTNKVDSNTIVVKH